MSVGKTYKTRNGGRCTIRYNSNDLGFGYEARSFAGTIRHSSGDRSAFFTVDGMYNHQKGRSDFDLVEEVVYTDCDIYILQAIKTEKISSAQMLLRSIKACKNSDHPEARRRLDLYQLEYDGIKKSIVELEYLILSK